MSRKRSGGSFVPKLSTEATLGLLFEVAVGILDHLHVGDSLVIWVLFGFGFVLIADAIVRGDWVSEFAFEERRRVRAMSGTLAFVLLAAFGSWIYGRRTHNDRKAIASDVPLPIESARPRPQQPTPPVPAPITPVASVRTRKALSPGSHNGYAIRQVLRAPGSMSQVGGVRNRTTVNHNGVPAPQADSTTLFEGNEGALPDVPGATYFRNYVNGNGTNRLNVGPDSNFVGNVVSGMDVTTDAGSFVYENVFQGMRSSTEAQTELENNLSSLHTRLQGIWRRLPGDARQKKEDLFSQFAVRVLAHTLTRREAKGWVDKLLAIPVVGAARQ